MAPPEKRVVAPGVQPVRTDNVKAQSWVNVRRNSRLIGQIFFATDNATLDFKDMALLDTVVLEYEPKVKRYNDLGRRVYFEYDGYADYRATPAHNYELSQKRADAVANHIGDAARLGQYTISYAYASRGRGIDYRGIDRPADSTELAEYRRVDIIAEPVDIPQPKPNIPGDLLSSKWKARLVRGGSGGYGPATLDAFDVEFVDTTNNIALTYKYSGVGLGVSPKGMPGFNAEKSSWVTFSTVLKISLMDFEGGAVHLGGQAQVSAGASIDELKLYGPEAHRGTPRFSLEWIGVSKPWDKGAGIGAMLTLGGLSVDPPGQKPYPAPGD
jgi:hypothetical protein